MRCGGKTKYQGPPAPRRAPQALEFERLLVLRTASHMRATTYKRTSFASATPLLQGRFFSWRAGTNEEAFTTAAESGARVATFHRHGATQHPWNDFQASAKGAESLKNQPIRIAKNMFLLYHLYKRNKEGSLSTQKEG